MVKKRTLGYVLVSSEDHSFFLKKKRTNPLKRGRMVALSKRTAAIQPQNIFSQIDRSDNHEWAFQWID